jgi:hypothetical protein
MKAARKGPEQMLTLATMAAVMTRMHIKAWLTRAESSFVYAERKMLLGSVKGMRVDRGNGLQKPGKWQPESWCHLVPFGDLKMAFWAVSRGFFPVLEISQIRYFRS